VLSSKVAINTFLFNGLKLGISAEVLSFLTERKTMASIDRIRPVIENAAYDDIRKFDNLQADE